MLLHIPEVLSGESLQQVQQLLEQAEWVDGKVTAGTQSAQVKNNMQLPEDSPAAQAAGHIILTALGHHPIFMSAALPKRVFPPLFNCYQGGMAFGNHVDNSVRTIARTGEHIRTDVSCTLFLAEPDSYEGGELIVEDTYGVHSVKLPAGHAVIYPSTSLHRVEPVTQGARVASFFWLQSMIRDDSKRALLFDMDMNIMRLRETYGDQETIIGLTATYHNLVWMWAEI